MYQGRIGLNNLISFALRCLPGHQRYVKELPNIPKQKQQASICNTLKGRGRVIESFHDGSSRGQKAFEAASCSLRLDPDLGAGRFKLRQSLRDEI